MMMLHFLITILVSCSSVEIKYSFEENNLCSNVFTLSYLDCETNIEEIKYYCYLCIKPTY